MLAAAVANLTYLAATASRPNDPDLGAIGLLPALLGLLLVVLRRLLDPSWPGADHGLHSIARASSRSRLLSSLPTAFISPGSRSGF